MSHPNQLATVSTSQCPTSATRVWLMLMLGAGAIVAALSLRYYPSVVRQAVTAMLGTDGRAALEHALAALGLPLVLHMMLMVPPLFQLRWGGLFPAWLRLSAKRNFAPLLSISSSIWLRSQSGQTRVNVTVASDWLTQNAGRILSVVYFSGTSLFEVHQAYISVYGGAPRGYLQYGQMLADAAGALLAMYAARRIVGDTEPRRTGQARASRTIVSP